MKKLRYLLSLLLIIATLASVTSCYFISAQRMSKLEGTYKLTSYTYTPSHERKDGYTPKSYDYVNDEEYMFEDYLIITGESIGYYVHKDASGEAYVKEVTLSYQYSEDDQSKVAYVTYNDSVSVNNDSGGIHKLGVANGMLNYSKSSIDYTELITKRPMRTESLSVKWEKVSKKTDLSYVEGELGQLKYYDYKSFSMRGIYDILYITDVETGEAVESRYKYYLYQIDTADGVTTARVYYAMADTPNERMEKNVSFSRADDFSTMTVDGQTWTLDSAFGNYYTYTDGFYDYTFFSLSQDNSDESVESFIDQRVY